MALIVIFIHHCISIRIQIGREKAIKSTKQLRKPGRNIIFVYLRYFRMHGPVLFWPEPNYTSCQTKWQSPSWPWRRPCSVRSGRTVQRAYICQCAAAVAVRLHRTMSANQFRRQHYRIHASVDWNGRIFLHYSQRMKEKKNGSAMIIMITLNDLRRCVELNRSWWSESESWVDHR